MFALSSRMCAPPPSRGSEPLLVRKKFGSLGFRMGVNVVLSVVLESNQFHVRTSDVLNCFW